VLRPPDIPQEITMTIEMRSLTPLLQVFDMTASLAFYRDVLGFEVIQQAPTQDDDCDWAWLRCNEAELILNTRYEKPERPPQPDAASVTAHDDTTLFIGCPDVDAAYEHLRARGIAVSPPTIAPYGMKQLNVKDPDGFSLCFQWPIQ
jgi:uncharacterized glyoxalase superfamily protein PhnB